MKLAEHIDTQYMLYPRIEERYIENIIPKGNHGCLEVIVGHYTGEEKTHYELDFSTESEQTISVGEHKYITLCYTPKSHYEALGSSQNGVIVVKDTNVPFEHPFPVSSWEMKYPASDMLKYGKLFKAETPWKLLCEIRSKLHEHLGTPSDEVAKDCPGKQYERALKGDYRLQCNNIVDIFVFACACKDIIARRINLWQGAGVWSWEDSNKFGAQLYTAQGHTTAEVFSDLANEWTWMDPMWGIRACIDCTLLDLRRDMSRLIDTYDGRNMLFYTHESFNAWRSYLNDQQRIKYVFP